MKSNSVLNNEQEKLVKLLQKFDVKFLIIGGHAVLAYANYRNTLDLDILLSKSKDNAVKLAILLKTISQTNPVGKWEEVLTRKNIRLAYPNDQNKEVDLLTSIDGIEFGKCYERSVEINFGNLTMQMPSLADLIEMKKKSLASGNDNSAHERDQADIVKLQELLELRT